AQCTNQDTCNGSGSCTDNGFKSSATLCTGTSQAGTCDNDAADHCTGTSAVCVDVFKASSVTCRNSVGQCDVAETCTGTSGPCPANVFASSATGCTGAAQAGACNNDAADHCSGTATSCVDVFQSSSTSCTGASQGGTCDNDASDHCSGT